MTSTIVVTGASSGFGAMTVHALAEAGHTVYAGMRATTGRNEAAAADAVSPEEQAVALDVLTDLERNLQAAERCRAAAAEQETIRDPSGLRILIVNAIR